MLRRVGFCVLERVYAQHDMEVLREALERSDVARTKAGARNLLALRLVRDLAYETALLSLACGELGSSAFPFRATLFGKSKRANWRVSWHQDTVLPVRKRIDAPGWGPWSVKAGVLHAVAPARALERVIAIRLHVDDSTPENGPLRVLPGSHCLGILDADQIQALRRAIAEAACPVPAGGVLMMKPLLVHASAKAVSDAPRRVLHIEYADDDDMLEGVRLGGVEAANASQPTPTALESSPRDEAVDTSQPRGGMGMPGLSSDAKPRDAAAASRARVPLHLHGPRVGLESPSCGGEGELER